MYIDARVCIFVYHLREIADPAKMGSHGQQ